ncbi:MAG: ornithine carbamoyltransferase [Spirochaetales bacterium]|nr:ornithine carbamoyltransferase [Spirochaetales bacterium]
MEKSAINGKYKGKSFLKLLDFSSEDIQYFLDLSEQLKAEKKAGIQHQIHKGKNVALLFEKTSTRTRCAFEVAAYDLGMNAVYLDPSGSQMGKKESIEDTAKVLGRMFDGIEYRGFGQDLVETLAKHAGVPVWNGLTNEFHPTQILADLLTIKEHFGSLKGKKLVYMGDARFNMGNSLMVGCAKMGMNFVACAPKQYFPAKDLVDQCQEIAKETGATLSFETDPEKATKGADAIYTDVWVSMGEPAEVWGQRIKDLLPYRVTSDIMANAGEKCIFLHCLPSFHDLHTTIGKDIYDKFGIDCMEVTDEVFNSKQSLVFDEAENRMHTIKAIMACTL